MKNITTKYMQYVCKNPKCNRMFIAEDLYGRTTPETFRYCTKCEAKGFPVIRFIKKNIKLQREHLRKRLF